MADGPKIHAGQEDTRPSRKGGPLKKFTRSLLFLLCKPTEKQRGPSANKLGGRGGPEKPTTERALRKRGSCGGLLLKDGSVVG